MMCVEVYILGATVVITARSKSWRRRGVDVGPRFSCLVISARKRALSDRMRAEIV
jgi:hypothetical protein